MVVLDETFALITVFEFPSTIVIGFVFAFASTFAFEFASTLVFEFASIAGVVSEDASEVVCKTEIFPVNAGIASSKAESINVVAAAIVIFDKIVCDPRGWKAVLEILLVKSAPALVLPGCNKTLAIKTIQDMKSNVYKK